MLLCPGRVVVLALSFDILKEEEEDYSYSWNQGTNQNKSMQNNQSQQPPSAMIANSNFQFGSSSTWIPDSGASFHVTGES